MSVFNYLTNLDWFFIEDFIVIFFFYSFFKYIILNSLIEIIWFTNYFNKKHLYSVSFFRIKNVYEVFLKLNNYNSYSIIFNIFFIYNFFKK